MSETERRGSPELDESDETPRRRRRRPKTRWEFILGIAVVAGVAAAFAPAKPTGLPVVDLIERSLFAFIITLFAASSRRWTWLILAGTATVLAATIWGHLLGAVALAFALHAAVRGSQRDRTTGALIGALSIISLLHTTSPSFFGDTALITGAVAVVVVISGYRTLRKRNKRRLQIAAAVVAVFGLLASAGFLSAVARATSPINSGVDFAQKGLDSATNARQSQATNAWLASHRFFQQADEILSTPFAKVAYVIPVLSQQAQVITTAAGSGSTITKAAAHAANVAPYRQLRAADGTFDLHAISTMEAPVADTAASMSHARHSLHEVTSPWLYRGLKSRVDRFQGQLDKGIPEALRALQAIKAAPELLGGNGTRHYLVLFANPAESRGMGGFIGAWAQLDATNGHLQLVKHGKMGSLDSATDPASRHISGEPEFLERYGHLQPARFIQNISASPDFPTVARVASQLYPQAGGTKLDGVLYIDPIALQALLKLTGPVRAEGIPMPLTSTNAAKFLMHDQYIDVATDDRSDLLSNAAQATFDALTHRKLPSIVDITDTLSPMVHQRRLLATVHNRQAESFLASVALTGAFPRPDGNDLVAVRYANGSANKADFFLDQATYYQADYDPRNGSTSGTVTASFANNAPASGLPAYVLGNQDTRAGNKQGRPFGSVTLQVSIHTALYPVSMTINGQSVGIQVQRELGAWVATQTITIPAGQRVTIVLRTQGKLSTRHGYRLVVAPQPGANPARTLVGVWDVSRQPSHKAKPTLTRTVAGSDVLHLSVPMASTTR